MKENMLMKKQNRMWYVWRGGLLKSFWKDFHCFSVQVVLHYLLPFTMSMIQATSTLIVCDFHCSLCSIFILQKYISLTLIIVCVCFFVNYRSSILLSSCFLVPHPIHASLLLSSKNVYGWKKCGFLCNKSSKTYKTSHYLHDVVLLLCDVTHIVSLTSVNKSPFS